MLSAKAAAKRRLEQALSIRTLDEADHGLAIAALVEHREAWARLEGRRRRLLDHAQRAGQEPAAGLRRLQRALAKPLAVGRVGEQQARTARSCRPRRAPVASRRKILLRPVRPKALDIAADQAAAFGRFLDEDAEGGAARQRFETERAGAGEQVEHARAVQLVGEAMRQHVEDRLAGAVGRRADGVCCAASPADARETHRRRSAPLLAPWPDTPASPPRRAFAARLAERLRPGGFACAAGTAFGLGVAPCGRRSSLPCGRAPGAIQTLDVRTFGGS